MAVTIATPTHAAQPIVAGNVRMTIRDITFDDSYPTGGESVSASDLGLQNVLAAIPVVRTAGTGSVTAVQYDVENGKLLAYTAAAQVANTTDLSAVTVRVIAFGK